VLAARLSDKLGWDVSLPAFAVGLSIGSATLPDEGCSGEDLMRDADRAMYRDKQRQKDQKARMLSVV
jgi:GGDEF domain-containing protein